MISFTIPLPPVTKKNHQSIKFNRNTGKRFIAPSEAYKKYEQDCLLLIPGSVRNFIECPVNIRSLYYCKSAHRVDITNLHNALHDVLVKAGVLKDDSSLAPRIVVEITEVEE